MKIALYLGSFNPFHNGHIEVIKTALCDFNMDRVVVVPTMQNPWKEDKPIPLNSRCVIIARSLLATIIHKPTKHYIVNGTRLSNWVNISKIEEKLSPPYYSYATLHALKTQYCNDEIYILCGEDTIEKIPDWMHGGKIIEDYNFLVVDRPKNSISSTEIRNKVKNGESIEGFVTPNVVEFIKDFYEC